MSNYDDNTYGDNNRGENFGSTGRSEFTSGAADDFSSGDRAGRRTENIGSSDTYGSSNINDRTGNTDTFPSSGGANEFSTGRAGGENFSTGRSGETFSTDDRTGGNNFGSSGVDSYGSSNRRDDNLGSSAIGGRRDDDSFGSSNRRDDNFGSSGLGSSGRRDDDFGSSGLGSSGRRDDDSSFGRTGASDTIGSGRDTYGSDNRRTDDLTGTDNYGSSNRRNEYGDDNNQNRDGKNDSTMGKLMEKAGAALKKPSLEEKGHEKREQKGFNDNNY